MKPLASTDLKHQIVVILPVEVDNGEGGYADELREIARPWAAVTGLPGREAVLNQALQGIAVYQVRIWHRDGVGPDMQIRFGAIDLNVRSVCDPFGSGRELLIIADTASTRAA